MSTSECDSLRCEHARFGYALTNIGDLDRDGYSGQCQSAALFIWMIMMMTIVMMMMMMTLFIIAPMLAPC